MWEMAALDGIGPRDADRTIRTVSTTAARVHSIVVRRPMREGQLLDKVSGAPKTLIDQSDSGHIGGTWVAIGWRKHTGPAFCGT